MLAFLNKFDYWKADGQSGVSSLLNAAELSFLSSSWGDMRRHLAVAKLGDI